LTKCLHGSDLSCELYFGESCTETSLRVFAISQWFITMFYRSYPFIEQDYQIYHQYNQWCPFLKNTKLAYSYS